MPGGRKTITEARYTRIAAACKVCNDFTTFAEIFLFSLELPPLQALDTCEEKSVGNVKYRMTKDRLGWGNSFMQTRPFDWTGKIKGLELDWHSKAYGIFLCGEYVTYS